MGRCQWSPNAYLIRDYRIFCFLLRSVGPLVTFPTSLRARGLAAAGASQRALQPERLCALAHEGNHVANVLVERQAEFLRAFPKVVAVDGPRERLVLHPLHHRRGLEV